MDAIWSIVTTRTRASLKISFVANDEFALGSAPYPTNSDF
jgi:hypothetical protein